METIKDEAMFLPPALYVNEQNYSTNEDKDFSSTKRSGEVVEEGG